MKVFLGTNFGHGSAAAVIDANGQLLWAVEEGRLLGVKEWSAFPDTALALVTQEFAGVVRGWSEGWAPLSRFVMKGVGQTARFAWRNPVYLNERLGREARRLTASLSKYPRWGRTFGRVRFVGHHDAHALSLLSWGLPHGSVVVVSDYIGERWSLSAYHWGAAGMRPLDRVPFPHSLGAAYQQLATHLGFRGSTGPGKVMALAAYGQPRWGSTLAELVRFGRTTFRVDQRRFPLWKRRLAWSELGERVGGELARETLVARNSWEHGQDLAASVQEWLTEVTWRYAERCVAHARDSHLPVRALGLAGGCALNCQANGEFARRISRLDLESLVISPWSDDSGTAIGAAVHAALSAAPGLEIVPSHPFLGPPAGALASPRDDQIEAAAGVLASGGVLALGVGRLEFGPRALGGRCLMGDPRSECTKPRLNRMKGRLPFMPFSPAVLSEEFGRYFSGTGSVNMTWTVPIHPAARRTMPGMDHPSGEARVQIVQRDGPPVLRRLLEAWRRRTGCGALLLTSLNGPGEPMPVGADACVKVAGNLGASAILLDCGLIQLP